MNDNYEIGKIISKGSMLGMKNFGSILAATVLFLLTFWIPYLNVGTFIGMSSLPLMMSKGTMISPTEIFDPKYRKNMGEFLLLMGFTSIIVWTGLMFMIIPGLVMAVAYGYGKFFLLDKEMTPSDALTTSNRTTYGKKWNIFLSKFLFSLIAMVAVGVFSYISPFLGIIPVLLTIPILMGIDAYIYSQLEKEI